MTTATLTKVGSSTAAFIPSKLREQAGIVVGDACSIESPHAGVVVHHFHTHSGNDRLVRFERPQSAIQAMGHTLPAWDDGLTADDLLRSGKATRANGIARLRAPPRLSVQRRGQLLSQGGVHAGADAACAPLIAQRGLPHAPHPLHGQAPCASRNQHCRRGARANDKRLSPACPTPAPPRPRRARRGPPRAARPQRHARCRRRSRARWRCPPDPGPARCPPQRAGSPRQTPLP